MPERLTDLRPTASDREKEAGGEHQDRDRAQNDAQQVCIAHALRWWCVLKGASVAPTEERAA